MKWMTHIHSQLVGGIVSAGTAFFFYSFLTEMESKRSSIKIHWLGALLYQIGGKPLLISFVSIAAGMIAWALWPEPRTGLSEEV